jgi:glycosyltransferase involved in cell wall biosynthesis
MAVVSVIVPTYNRAETLPRAIDSVFQQTHMELELVVVDDGSTDETPSVVREYDDDRLRYLRHEENKNASVARNTGLEAATGEYVAFLDSDDEWHPEKLSRQLEAMKAAPTDCAGNYCGVEIRRGSKLTKVLGDVFDNDATYSGQEAVVTGLLTLSGLMHAGSTLLVRRSVADEIGGFDERFDRHQDIEFTIRVAQVGPIHHLDETLVTLHSSAGPSPDDVADAKARLFEKFGDEIKRLEAQGHPIRRNHDFVQARHYIREGQFRRGLSRLVGSWPSTLNHLFGLGLDIVRGVSARRDRH